MKRKLFLGAGALLAIGIFVGTAWYVEESTLQKRQEAMVVYEAVRNELSKVVLNAEKSLDSLAAQDAMRNGTPQQCGELLAQALAAGPEIYDVFLRIKADGNLDCTPAGASKPVDFSSRLYFTKAVEKREFIVGEFLVGKVSGKQVLAVARPIISADGTISHVLVCGLKTDWLQAVIDSQKDTMDLIVEISDASGVLLSYFIAEDGTDLQSASRVELVRLPLLPGQLDAEVVIYTAT
jgi:hypothetical protein